MWIADYVDDLDKPRLHGSSQQSSKTSIQKYLKGPKVMIGRHKDCDIIFTQDKTVSRQHAELSLEIITSHSQLFDEKEKKEEASLALFIKDLNSKFHIFRGEQKLPANEKIRIQSGDVIKLGGGITYIRFFKLQMVCASTRLEPHDKSRYFIYEHCLYIDTKSLKYTSILYYLNAGFYHCVRIQVESTQKVVRIGHISLRINFPQQ